jgi:hypothetical protein
MKIVKKFIKETEHIRSLAALTTDYFYLNHAEEQMLERGIDKFDIESTLLSCNVIEDQTIGAEESKWKVQGCSVDKRKIEIVVAVESGELEIQIITAWSKGKKK